MVQSCRRNAILERLDYLEGLWNEFGENPDARLLCWLTDQEEAKMVDLLVDRQAEKTGQIPDLFVKFIEPFDDYEQYGLALRQSLINQYEEIRGELAKDGMASEWECPDPVGEEPGVITFARSCISFQEYYEELMVHLVLYLVPPEISDETNWRTWLLTLTRAGLPTNIRIMVIDDVKAPILDRLSKEERTLVVSTEPKLDMISAYRELANA